MTTYQELRQKWVQTLRSRFDGREMLNMTEVAQVYGYRDANKAKAEVAHLPAYHCGAHGKRRKYAIGDIAGDLAQRAQIPGASR